MLRQMLILWLDSIILSCATTEDDIFSNADSLARHDALQMFVCRRAWGQSLTIRKEGKTGGKRWGKEKGESGIGEQ